MKPKPSDWVYISPRYLLFRQPGSGVFHAKGRQHVPQYGHPEEEPEKVWTGCGRLVYTYHAGQPGGMRRRLEVIRRDLALAMDARPCRPCHMVPRGAARYPDRPAAG